MARTKKAQESKGTGTTSLEPERKGRSLPFRHLIAVGLIAGVALAAYSNTFNAPFHFDDLPNIVQNPLIQIKTFTWDRLERLVKYTYKENTRIFSDRVMAAPSPPFS